MISNTCLILWRIVASYQMSRTKDQLCKDKTVLNDCRERYTNLGTAWIEYKKAHDMIPHSWVLESLEIAKW